MGMSQSPSASSLSALASQDGRPEGQRSRLGSNFGSASIGEDRSASAVGSQQAQHEHGATLDISLAPQRTSDSINSGSAPPLIPKSRPMPSQIGGDGAGTGLTAMEPPAVTALRNAPGNSQGSESGVSIPSPNHARKRSVESIGGGGGGGGTSGTAAAAAAAAAATVHCQAVHYRSPSTESVSLNQATPAGSPPMRQPPTGADALMVFKLHEFLDGRGIASVVPVANPNDTSEPQLLGMSPEQAEETAAKLRELETDMLLGRQENARGWACCGLMLSRENDSLPDHLRVWEMTLA